eukprot:7622360-Heterocapsa_arctica.AAC.1
MRMYLNNGVKTIAEQHFARSSDRQIVAEETLRRLQEEKRRARKVHVHYQQGLKQSGHQPLLQHCLIAWHLAAQTIKTTKKLERYRVYKLTMWTRASPTT